MNHNFIKYCAVSLTLCLVASCGTYQKYERERLFEISEYRNSKAADSTSLAQLSWDVFFEDEILKQHISTALSQNLDLLKAQERIKITNSLLRQARANFLPALNANAAYGFNQASNQNFMGQGLPNGTNFDDLILGGSLSWELDIWGKINNQKKAAIAEYYRTENTQRLIQTQIISSVANLYFRLQALDAKREIILSTIENRKEGIEMTKALKESGKLTEVAVKQTEAQYLTAESILRDIDNFIVITENALSVLLAKAPNSIERKGLDPNSISQDLTKTGYPIQVLDNRPDVIAAEFNLVQALELTNVAQANFYPSLSITAQGGLNSENFSDLFNSNAVFANIIGGLVQPLFNQRRIRTQKEIRLSEQEIAVLDYKQSVLIAYQEIANELMNNITLSEKLNFKSQERDALQNSLEYSNDLLVQGFINYLEILRAKDIVLSTEFEVIDLLQLQLENKTNLYRALGGGWQ